MAAASALCSRRQHACRYDRGPDDHAPRFCTAARISLRSLTSEMRVHNPSDLCQPAAEDRGPDRLPADKNSNADEAYGPVDAVTPLCHLESMSPAFLRSAKNTYSVHGQAHEARLQTLRGLPRLPGDCRLRLRFWKLTQRRQAYRLRTVLRACTCVCTVVCTL